MIATLEAPPVQPRPPDGGVPARRAVVRWAWRLFRREWRQQLLVLLLIVGSVAATVVGAAVATNSPPPATNGFGSAQDMVQFPGNMPGLQAQIAQLARRYSPIEVIENQTLFVPGSVTPYELRAQSPDGRYGRPMLRLLGGRFPSAADEVAMTRTLAATLGLHLGDAWTQAGVSRRLVGIVEDPQSLLSQFALVLPGQVTHPTSVTVLFDAPRLRSLGGVIQSRASAGSGNPLNPQTIVLALATILMLLVGLVAVGGFSVLAQRRLRSIAMLETIGATDKHIRLVVRANGAIVGLVGAGIGFLVGLAVWLAYRPHLETTVHHLIGAFQLPWAVIGPTLALAVLASFMAATRPARTITQVPVVAALSGRPAPPRQIRRSAIPGLVAAVLAFFLLGSAAANVGAGGGPQLVIGLVALVAAVILLAPFVLSAFARLADHSPLAVRLSLRDLARYRARSGSALAAISVGMLIAVLIAVVAAARYGDVLDYVGPNLSSNQLLVQWNPPPPQQLPGNPTGPGKALPGGIGAPPSAATTASVQRLAAALGATRFVPLEDAGVTLRRAAAGRQFNGNIFVATPTLLRAFGIRQSQIPSGTYLLTSRPGLAGLSRMQLLLMGRPGDLGQVGPHGQQTHFPCPRTDCIADPRIEQVGALPAGTAGPNIVITEQAVRALGLHPVVAAWLIQTANALTPAQIRAARLAAAAVPGVTIETKSEQPTSNEVIYWATVFGILLALGVLAISVGLIRSETARDLRTLAATGASGFTRRNITAATAASLALAGAVLGTAAAYLGALAFFRESNLDALAELGNPPTGALLILLLGLPALAALAGWLLGGRDPAGMGRQAIE